MLYGANVVGYLLNNIHFKFEGSRSIFTKDMAMKMALYESFVTSAPFIAPCISQNSTI